jgi:hypothetical protein
VLDAAGSATGILSFFVFLVSVLALLVQKYRILTEKALEDRYTQFTCFASTKARILAQTALSGCCGERDRP